MVLLTVNSSTRQKVRKFAQLVSHQCDKWRYNQDEARNKQGCELVDQRFTATCCQHNQSISIEELVRLTATEDGPHPLNRFNDYQASGATYPYGSHIIEIEVDKASFVPQIVRYTTMDDFGNILNPLTLFGQIQGGIAQGVGQALLEHVVYDDSGQLLAGSLMDYALPRADHFPGFQISTRNTACANNALGIKGSGEAGAIGAPQAVISAICDALEMTHIDMPATPLAIFNAMKAKTANLPKNKGE